MSIVNINSTPIILFLDDINRFDEMLLFGFIRNMETQNNLTPMVIYKIISRYYAIFTGNVFDDAKCSERIEISNKLRNTVHKIDNEYGYYSVYHSVWIDSLCNAIVIYDLSVKFERATSVYIGFAATDGFIEDGFWTNTKSHNYGLSLEGGKYMNGKRKHISKGIDVGISSGDNIMLKLDLINFQICLKTVDAHEVTIFRNIEQYNDMKYKFAVGFSWNASQGDSVTLNNIKHYGL